jgi:thiol:disulfide interchange protein
LLLAAGNLAQAQRETTSTAPADSKGINFFQGTWNEALAAAKKEKKLIFVDAYAVWCGPCKFMSNNVFPDAAVGEYFNKNFISYKFDMEKGEGPEFSNKYKVTAYPTLLFINAAGEVVYREMGARDANGFIKLGESALAAFKK